MKKLIVANWKMNPQDIAGAKKLLKESDRRIESISDHTEAVVCPPFVFLPALAHRAKHVTLGAQNVSWSEAGALTGEVSALELEQLGVEYVIVGHSERRLYLGETDSVVNAKILELLNHRLTPIVCLGGEEGATEDGMKALVTKQFHNCTKGLAEKDLAKLVYAYEPVWAISTMKDSKPATGGHARELIGHIYNLLEKQIGKASENIRVLYGGTVNKDNVHEYAKYPEICGALVGAASLDADNFGFIVSEFNREAIHRA